MCYVTRGYATDRREVPPLRGAARSGANEEEKPRRFGRNDSVAWAVEVSGKIR